MENRKQRTPLYWAIFAVAITLPAIVPGLVRDFTWAHFWFDAVVLTLVALVTYVLIRTARTQVRKESGQ